MKFPFDFSLSLVFRLIFPGMVIAVAIWPLIVTLLGMWGLETDYKIILPVEALIAGWLIVLSDQPIYQLYEGRIGWPGFMRRWGIKCQARRLAKANQRSTDLSLAKDDAAAAEWDLVSLDFPFGEDGQPCAKFPTRLGNLIDGSETYSDYFWKIDSIFYWPRLWTVLDKDLKSSLDEQQAIADGALYVSFALSLSGLVFLGYFAGGLIADHWHRYFDLKNLPSVSWTGLLSLAMFLLAYGIYRLSLFQQRIYGELFKSIFDQHQDKLKFAITGARLALREGTDPQLVNEKHHRVTEKLLRWNLIEPTNEEIMTPQVWKKKRDAKP
jgi:hypothetical protein